MINIRTLASKLSSLIQRIDHDEPAVIMIANTNPINSSNTTMTNRSIQPNQERNVQHGSSTWLEQPTIVVLPDLISNSFIDSFVPVNSMRRFCPVGLARLDQPATHDAFLASSGSRFAPLQESEDEDVTLDNQGDVAEKPPNNDRDVSTDDSDDRDPAKQAGSKTTGIKHSGPQPLKQEAPIASTSNISDTTKNPQKNLATVNPDGWHQAILPQGHAQAPQNNMKKKVPSPKERKLYSKLARRNHPHVKRSPAEVAQKMKAQEQKSKLKPPPPVYPTHRTHEDSNCPMYGRIC